MYAFKLGMDPEQRASSNDSDAKNADSATTVKTQQGNVPSQ